MRDAHAVWIRKLARSALDNSSLTTQNSVLLTTAAELPRMLALAEDSLKSGNILHCSASEVGTPLPAWRLDRTADFDATAADPMTPRADRCFFPACIHLAGRVQPGLRR